MTKTIETASVPNTRVATKGPKQVGWPRLVGYLSAGWSLAYGVLGLCWTFGGPGFPFGAGDPKGADSSILAGVTPQGAGPVIAVVGLLGATIAVAATRGGLPGMLRRPVLAFGALMALCGVLLPDFRVLMVIAYAPVFALGAPFGWPRLNYFAALTWPVVNLLLVTVGGLLWLLTTLSYQRRTRAACVSCGRGEHGAASWTTAASAARWGRRATWVAVTVPILYDLTRWAWAAGIPLGITRAYWEQGQRQGLWLAGAALGLLGFGGAVLTHGLVRPWGERFPRWMLGFAGKRVPIMLAVVPALIVATIVTSAGVMVIRLLVRQGLSMQMWATLGPMTLWPVWGVSLAVAAIGYYFRRRGTCRRCRRG